MSPQFVITGCTNLTIAGTTTLQPSFTAAQPAFDAANGTKTTVEPGGNSVGLTDVESGETNVAMTDVFAQSVFNDQSSAALIDNQVAATIYTMVVNSDVGSKITNLTSKQIQGIYNGSITDWHSINPRITSEAIPVITKQSGISARVSFDNYVFGAQSGDQPVSAVVAGSDSVVLMVEMKSPRSQ